MAKIKDYKFFVRRKLWIIIFTIIVVLGGKFYSSNPQAYYRATTYLWLNTKNTVDPDLQSAIGSFQKEIVKSVGKSAELNRMQDKGFSLSINGKSPELSAQIANEITIQLAKEIQVFLNKKGEPTQNSAIKSADHSAQFLPNKKRPLGINLSYDQDKAREEQFRNTQKVLEELKKEKSLIKQKIAKLSGNFDFEQSPMALTGGEMVRKLRSLMSDLKLLQQIYPAEIQAKESEIDNLVLELSQFNEPEYAHPKPLGDKKTQALVHKQMYENQFLLINKINRLQLEQSKLKNEIVQSISRGSGRTNDRSEHGLADQESISSDPPMELVLIKEPNPSGMPPIDISKIDAKFFQLSYIHVLPLPVKPSSASIDSFPLAIGFGLGIFLTLLVEIYTKPRVKDLERVKTPGLKSNAGSGATNSGSFNSATVDSLFPQDGDDSPPLLSLIGENKTSPKRAPKGNLCNKYQKISGLRCFLVNREKEQTELKSLKATSRKSYIRVILVGQGGVPLANKPFTLTAHGREFVGRTNKNGLVDQEVPKYMTKGILAVKINEGKNVEKTIVWEIDAEDHTLA